MSHCRHRPLDRKGHLAQRPPMISSRRSGEWVQHCLRLLTLAGLAFALTMGPLEALVAQVNQTQGEPSSGSRPAGGPVTATMKATAAEVKSGDTFDILVQVEIAVAYHLYASNS